ncbi:TetR/AcrR family transcriptional regulator [Cryptosporangium phraense]|uniref:TetR/AcrR family transcriptional regulator n=1 Tax=Cryptosporangium phraense TaxID=2593070 RepID=UPI0014789789|nr:TetR/AcrR family transcriptional regulator [Cryptosporangium phraense]
MSFGKPGRPPEDHTLRRREIYLAVMPLIDDVGYRRLSMKAAARAANLSIGGLYHYFPTKRELVLHPLTEDFGRRYCADLNAVHAPLLDTDPERYVRLKLHGIARCVAVARPAFHAAVEMGLDAYRESVEAGLTHSFDAVEDALRHIEPALPEDAIRAISRSMRRVLMAAIIDRTTTEAEIVTDCNRVLDSFLPRPALVP